MSTDWAIEEFNHEAEKYFGVKRENTLKEDFFQLFVPESLQSKKKQILKRMLNKLKDGRLKTEVIAANGNTGEVVFSARTLLNTANEATGIVLMGDWDQ